MIVFGSGNRGATFWGGAEPHADPVPWGTLTELRSAGYITVERAWQDQTGGWFIGAEGAGLTGASCRFATLLHAIAEQTPADEPLCALGSSAGSVELSYALAAYGLDERVQFAMFSGGPIARVDHACTGEWDCVSATTSHPATACSTVRCDVGELVAALDLLHAGACRANDSERLRTDSLASLTADRLALQTETSFQWGDGDCLGIAQSGRAAADLFGSNGVAVTQRVIADAGHSVQRSPAGGANIVQEMQRGCVP
ncbi:MAG: hypothetical protein AAF645_02955 [Myxococcota bacterium]